MRNQRHADIARHLYRPVIHQRRTAANCQHNRLRTPADSHRVGCLVPVNAGLHLLTNQAHRYQSTAGYRQSRYVAGQKTAAQRQINRRNSRLFIGLTGRVPKQNLQTIRQRRKILCRQLIISLIIIIFRIVAGIITF